MVVRYSTDIFQEDISKLFEGFVMVNAYIDDIIVITHNDVKYNLNVLEKAPQRLAESVLKVNSQKSLFGQTETEFIGFCVCNNVVRPISPKVQAIKAINVPDKARDVHIFVGLFNYYMDMWRKHAHILDPLTKLCST